MTAARVASIIGWTVTFNDAVDKGPTLACLYEGSVGNVTIEKESGIPASSFSTLAKAESGTRASFPKGTRISFFPLSALGPRAFFWTAVIGGHPFSGANDYKATKTGYFSEMAGTLQRTRLEQLEKLAIAA